MITPNLAERSGASDPITAHTIRQRIYESGILRGLSSINAAVHGGVDVVVMDTAARVLVLVCDAAPNKTRAEEAYRRIKEFLSGTPNIHLDIQLIGR